MAVSTTISAAHTAIAGLFRSTALTLVTTAVMASASRSQIIGSENALKAKVTMAKTDPTADPTARNPASCLQSGCPSSGKNTCSMDPARAQTRNTTSSASAKTMAVPRLRRCSPKHCRSDGRSPRPSWRLME